MSDLSGPDFVCIGAQKAGTTWLYENLAKHPDVWMPPIKEFHYFNRVCVNESLLGKWSTPHPHGVKRYTEAIKKADFRKIRWLLRYYESGMEKDWYQNLFDETFTRGKVSGDITPAYSTMDERGVRYASDVLDNDTPVLLILRNPVYRSWSAAKMLLRYGGKSVDEVSKDEIFRLLEAPHIRLGNEYSKTILLWKKYFNNVHVLSFDELCDSPRTLLQKISQLLSIADTWDEVTVSKRVWADEKNILIPDSVLTALNQYYAPEIDQLREMGDCEFVERWFDGLGDHDHNG